MNKKFIRYKHHGEEVSVREDLKGRHKEFCLCYSCEHFIPDSALNCLIAQTLYKLDVHFDLVTPVWECPEFKEIQDE